MRADYAAAVKDKKLCEANLKTLEAAANTATEKGYLAAYEILWAKHMGNLFQLCTTAMCSTVITSTSAGLQLNSMFER